MLTEPQDPPTPYNIRSLGPVGGRLAPTLPHLTAGSIIVGRAEFLPLNLIAHILTFLEDDPATLAALCRTRRLLYYMALPLLWKNVSLISSGEVRRKKCTHDGEMKDVPEGVGGASPFAMGLNAMVTHPNVGKLIRRLSLAGDYGEGDPEVQRCSKAGRVSEIAMMLNICVRAAVDRCTELEEFVWNLDTRLMPTAYRGLAHLSHLRSLRIRMPSSRASQPTGQIPPMLGLRRLVITDYDPLCYPDDISDLVYEAQGLEDLQVHFSPRMREASEPSVQLSHLIRKNINSDRKLKLKRLGVYNFFGKPEAELTTKAANISTVEDFTSINSFGKDEDESGDLGSTFMDRSWTEGDNIHMADLKVWRVDQLHRGHLKSFGVRKGMEKIYLINARHGQSTTDSPASSDTSLPSSATIDSSRSKSISPITPTPPTLKELYLDAICKASGATLKHLIFPHKWVMSTTMVGKLIRCCPNLTQLSAALDCPDMEFAQILLPFLSGLEAVRVTVVPDMQCGMPISEREKFLDSDEALVMLQEMVSSGGYDALRYLGMGERVWEVGGWKEVVRSTPISPSSSDMREEKVMRRKIKRISLDDVKDIAIWRYDSLDVI